MTDCLLLTHQGQLNNQIEQPRDRYYWEEFSLQGQYNCSWHTGPALFFPWLELIPQPGILFGLCLVTCTVSLSCKMHFLFFYIYISPGNVTCFIVEKKKMSCLPLGCHFPLKGCYTVPWCSLRGPRSVFRLSIKMQENFRKCDTYPLHIKSNLRLFGLPNIL